MSHFRERDQGLKEERKADFAQVSQVVTELETMQLLFGVRIASHMWKNTQRRASGREARGSAQEVAGGLPITGL